MMKIMFDLVIITILNSKYNNVTVSRFCGTDWITQFFFQTFALLVIKYLSGFKHFSIVLVFINLVTDTY